MLWASLCYCVLPLLPYKCLASPLELCAEAVCLWRVVFVQELDGGGSALQQPCSVIRPHEGSSSGQGTMSLFSLCKFLLPEASMSRIWYRNRQYES